VVQLKQIESATEEEKQTAKDWQQVEEIIRGNPYREAVKQEMYKMSQDEKERYLYLREEMAVSDEVSRMRTAIKEGIKRGIKLTKKVFQLSQKGCTIAQIAEKCNIEESEVKEILE
jgi:DNA-binding NarL/FixJ family response regulator